MIGRIQNNLTIPIHISRNELSLRLVICHNLNLPLQHL